LNDLELVIKKINKLHVILTMCKAFTPQEDDEHVFGS